MRRHYFYAVLAVLVSLLTMTAGLHAYVRHDYVWAVTFALFTVANAWACSDEIAQARRAP